MDTLTHGELFAGISGFGAGFEVDTMNQDEIANLIAVVSHPDFGKLEWDSRLKEWEVLLWLEDGKRIVPTRAGALSVAAEYLNNHEKMKAIHQEIVFKPFRPVQSDKPR